MKQASALKAYPSYGFEPVPHPANGPAIIQPGVRYALWRRARRHLSRAAVGGAALATAISVTAAVNLTGFAAYADVVAMLTSTVVLLRGTAGVIWTGHLWRHLARSQWNVMLGDGTAVVSGWPVVTVYADGRDIAGNRITFELAIRRSKLTEQFNADGPRELWFAGNPGRSGILTPAGGGDMFFARGRLAANVHRNRNVTELPAQFRPFSAVPKRETTSKMRYSTALAAARRANLPRRPRRGRVKKRK